MKQMIKVKYLWLWGVCLFYVSGLSAQMPSHMVQMMDWEFDKNPAQPPSSSRNQTAKDFVVTYYEIPVEKLHGEILPGTEEAVIKSVFEERDGVKYVRWFVNPEDTKYHLEVEQFLQQENIPIVKKNGKDSRLSASRSCLTLSCDDDRYALFYKASTNKTGGNWTSTKKVNGNQVRKALQATKLSAPIKKNFKLSHLALLDEPVGIHIGGQTDQGLLFRSLGEYASDDYLLLPAFTAVHESEGPRIAALNTSDPDHMNPAEYWEKHYIKPLALATAEFIATHGLLPTNPHSQQYLIPLDKNYVPTGKMIFRDYNDADLFKPFFHDSGSSSETKKLLDDWMERYSKNDLKMLYGPLHGGPSWLSWLSQSAAKKWRETYFDVFNEKFSQLTQIPLSFLENRMRFNSSMYNAFSYNDYTIGNHHVESEEPIKRWIQVSQCFRGLEKTSNGLLCVDILDCWEGSNSYSRNGLNCEKVLGLLNEKDPAVIAQLVPETAPNCSVTNSYSKVSGILSSVHALDDPDSVALDRKRQRMMTRSMSAASADAVANDH